MAEATCGCEELDDLAVIGMGSAEDDRVRASLHEVRAHGGTQWWLYAATCSSCGQGWLTAQESRIHDNYVLKRIAPATLHAIVAEDRWPDDFMRLEDVLRIESESGKIARFLDPVSPALVDTARELRAARPDITLDEIAFALAISPNAVARLLRH